MGMARVNIYVPDGLHRKMLELKGGMGAQSPCRAREGAGMTAAAPADEVGRMVEQCRLVADRVTCYASTTSEYPPNEAAILLRQAAELLESIAAERDRLREENSRQWQLGYDAKAVAISTADYSWKARAEENAESLAAANAAIARLERELNATARRRAEEIKQQKPRKL
jgi:hypothetical protein